MLINPGIYIEVMAKPVYFDTFFLLQVLDGLLGAFAEMTETSRWLCFEHSEEAIVLVSG